MRESFKLLRRKPKFIYLFISMENTTVGSWIKMKKMDTKLKPKYALTYYQNLHY